RLHHDQLTYRVHQTYLALDSGKELTRPQNPCFPPSNTVPVTPTEFSDVSVEEVCRLLNNLSTSKATGPDGISARLLKECLEVLAASLTALFNKSIAIGKVPADRKYANIVPITKNNKTYIVCNYRPISLLSLVSKALEHVLYNRVLYIVKPLLHDQQHSFRSPKSCITQLLDVVYNIGKVLDCGKEMDMIYLDFSKAFDSVPHDKLIFKLSQFGITGPLLDWFSDYLSGCKQRLVVDGFSSSYLDVTSGVPQGSIVGPLLFLIYVNDLPDAAKHSKVPMFANDIKPNCYVCNTGNEGGAHKCCECNNNVHVFCGTAVSNSDEGYGQPVICFKLHPVKVRVFVISTVVSELEIFSISIFASTSPIPKNTEDSTNLNQSMPKVTQISAFDVLKACTGRTISNMPSKRQESGHKNTFTAIFVTCYNVKRRCTLGHFNKSTIERHQKNVHQHGEQLDVISVEDPRAVSILKELKSASIKKSASAPESKKRQHPDNTISCSTQSKRPCLDYPSASSSSTLLEKPTHTSDIITSETESEDANNNFEVTVKSKQCTDSFIKLKQKEAGTAHTRIDELIKKVDKVLTLVSAGGYSRQPSSKATTDTTLPSNDELPGNEASNLPEFLSAIRTSCLFPSLTTQPRHMDFTMYSMLLNISMPQEFNKRKFRVSAFHPVLQRDLSSLAFISKARTMPLTQLGKLTSVEGQRQAIALNASRVYTKSDSSGGTGQELASKLLNDVQNHAKITGRAILAMQSHRWSEELWWPLQWCPGHWLDNVDDNQFVSHLLLRTNLFHTMFNRGKMHTVAKETAKELKLPFKTTVSFAKQRFMSSSYKQFLKLETSIEAYINAFRDHDNEEVKEYKLAGQDFVFDLLGVIDLLWPLVLIMLRGQMLSCPGWKIATWIPQVKDQIWLPPKFQEKYHHCQLLVCTSMLQTLPSLSTTALNW
ncbi:Hypothetical predicted protein, partial [Paramuricea clavata]